MKKELEIERKFLLKGIPKIDREHYELNIVQLYIKVDGQKFRIRETKRAGCITIYDKIIKKRLSVGVNEEEIYHIDKYEFHRLSAYAYKKLYKTRIVVPMDDGLKWEIDIFHHPIVLVLAEIETKKVDQDVNIPHFIRQVLIMEVTEFNEFSNIALAEELGQE